MKHKLASALLLAALMFRAPAYSIGSGGILNLVPQARVLEREGDRWISREFSVYVHPLEGSILLVARNSDTAIAFDKNKKHTITLKVTDISIAEDGRSVDVPEKTPFVVLPFAPHFNRTFIEARIDQDRLIRVEVER